MQKLEASRQVVGPSTGQCRCQEGVELTGWTNTNRALGQHIHYLPTCSFRPPVCQHFAQRRILHRPARCEERTELMIIGTISPTFSTIDWYLSQSSNMQHLLSAFLADTAYEQPSTIVMNVSEVLIHSHRYSSVSRSLRRVNFPVCTTREIHNGAVRGDWNAKSTC